MLWPAGIFGPLRDFGIEVGSLDVWNDHQLNRAFRGAARHWRLTTWPWNWLIIFCWFAVAVVVLFLLIDYGIID